MERVLHFNEVRLTMTANEFEKTDFRELTDKLLVDEMEAKIGGSDVRPPLIKRYQIDIVDEQGHQVDTHHIEAQISPDVFVYEHPEYGFNGIWFWAKDEE